MEMTRSKTFVVALLFLPLLALLILYQSKISVNETDYGQYQDILHYVKNVGLFNTREKTLGHKKVSVFQNTSVCSDINTLNETITETEELDNFIDVCEEEEVAANNRHLCKFCNNEPAYLNETKPFVALASYPCSGNSWTRELLESMTGIITGSIYADSLGKFKGSKQCPHRGGVYIIKTHIHGNETHHLDCSRMGATEIYYQKAMLILRNPYDAMISLFNLARTRNKTGFASWAIFNSKAWTKFVRSMRSRWAAMNIYWMTKFERPVHIIVYEELTTNTFKELYDIGKFLDLEVKYLDLYCAKYCLKPKYRRDKKPKWLNKASLFNDDLKRLVNSAVYDVLNSTKHLSYLEPVLKSYIL